MIRELLRSKLFWIGIVIRLGLLWLPGSHYLNELFIPFLDKAVLNPGQNPWALSSPEAFPYGSVLFVFLFAPRYLLHLFFSDLALGVTALGIMSVKGVLLAFDFALLVCLCKFAKAGVKSLALFYWLNPVLIYISYIHGQLDVVSVAFCFLSLYLIGNNAVFLSALAMSAGILSKFHLVILIPFWVVFLWKRNFVPKSVKNLVLWSSTVCFFTMLGFWPLISIGRLGSASVLSPEIMRLFTLAIPLSAKESFYIGVLVVVGLLGRLCISTRISIDGLIFGSGLLFTGLVLGTFAAPGWFFWFIPFMAFAAARYNNFPRTAMIAVIILYFGYFEIAKLLPQHPILMGGLFTVLQTSVLWAAVSLYIVAVKNEASTAGRVKPVMIGVAGDSGVGKNHISHLLGRTLGGPSFTIVEGDDYHKWERGHDSWERYTHLNPKANHLLHMAKHAAMFSQGRRMLQPHYNHQTGKFSLPRLVSPAKTVILQGLHTLYLCGLRQGLDLKIFLKATPELRLAWKLRRDISQRGAVKEKVLETFRRRAEDSERYIGLQERFADWAIEYFPRNVEAGEDLSEKNDLKIGARFTLPNDYDFDELLTVAAEFSTLNFDVQFLREEIDRIELTVTGEATPQQIQAIAEKSFPDLRQLTRSIYLPKWESDIDGVIQLFALGFFQMRMRNS